MMRGENEDHSIRCGPPTTPTTSTPTDTVDTYLAIICNNVMMTTSYLMVSSVWWRGDSWWWHLGYHDHWWLWWPRTCFTVYSQRATATGTRTDERRNAVSWSHPVTGLLLHTFPACGLGRLAINRYDDDGSTFEPWVGETILDIIFASLQYLFLWDS